MRESHNSQPACPLMTTPCSTWPCHRLDTPYVEVKAMVERPCFGAKPFISSASKWPSDGHATCVRTRTFQSPAASHQSRSPSL
eukprot:6183290-Pleurochrysis_carterae.AAC.7